jgi:hypothetical protein
VSADHLDDQTRLRLDEHALVLVDEVAVRANATVVPTASAAAATVENNVLRMRKLPEFLAGLWGATWQAPDKP